MRPLYQVDQTVHSRWVTVGQSKGVGVLSVENKYRQVEV